MSGKIGRPTKRTPETVARIVAALEKGYTKSAAAAAAGLTYTTMREWELAFPEFADVLQKAENAAKGELIDKIRAAESWQASAWMLERRWPDEFAHRAKVDMTLDVTGEARKVAKSLGLDEATVLDEAEAILAGKR